MRNSANSVIHLKSMNIETIKNDSCDIHIVVGEDTYYIKYTPYSFRDRIDGLIGARGICNTVNCYVALNNGTLRVIEVRFKDGEVVIFYIK